MLQRNREWSDKIIKKVDPGFKHRWEVYNELLQELLTSDSVWIDCGCGDNGIVKTYGHLAKKAIGTDIADPENPDDAFIKANADNLPFPSEYADIITLRFVVEHFDGVQPYFSELSRVLKKGGKVVILTTNAQSPVIFVPEMLLPYSVKHKILTRLFRVDNEDVFPTHHKVNKVNQLKNLSKNLRLERIEYISDLNYTRKWVFLLLLSWHTLTRMRGMQILRTNLLSVLEKI